MIESFVLYRTQCKSLLKLPVEKRGELITGIIKFALEGEQPEFEDLACELLFDQISEQISRDQEKYQKRCEKNRQIALDREAQKRNSTNVHERAGTSTNSTYTYTDNDNGTYTDNDTGNGTETEDDTVQQIVACSSVLPHPLTENQARKMMETYSPDATRKILQIIGNNPFLRGQNEKGWRATGEWLLKPENAEKVLSGHYDRWEPSRPDRVPGQTAFYENDWRDYLK